MPETRKEQLQQLRADFVRLHADSQAHLLRELRRLNAPPDLLAALDQSGTPQADGGGES